jgi:glycosyltransferase involved in cell wall biosynthesis
VSVHPSAPEHRLTAPRQSELSVLLCLAAGKVSEPRIASYQQMQDSRVVLVGLDSRKPAPNLIRLPAWKLPYLGAPERWTTGLNWYRRRRFNHLEPGRVDCVLSLELHSPSSVQASRLAKRLGVPHVVTVAEVLDPCPLASLPPWRQFSRYVSKSADAVVCSVEMGRQAAIAMGCDAAKCHVIAPGVDAARFTPRVGGRALDPVLLFVGELRPDKGILDIMAAVRRARTDIPDLRLVIVGDGPLRAAVAAEAAEAPFMEYRGKVPRNELVSIYQEARGFIIAPKTRWLWAEQFGFASVEAMACGLPVVITDSGAVPDVVPNWNPICPQGDVAALAAGIVATMGEPGDAMGRRNRARVEERYDDVNQAAELRSWLGELVAAAS